MRQTLIDCATAPVGQSIAREQADFGDFPAIGLWRTPDCACKQMHPVARAVQPMLKYAQCTQAVQIAADLLMPFARGGVFCRFAAPDPAAGQAPQPSAIGMAHQQHAPSLIEPNHTAPVKIRLGYTPPEFACAMPQPQNRAV